jgi:hypothetical protein
MEQQMLGDAGGPSTNLDESGMFSVQVGSVLLGCLTGWLAGRPSGYCR